MSSNATPLWIDTLWIALICKKQRCDLRGGDNLSLSLSLSLPRANLSGSAAAADTNYFVWKSGIGTKPSSRSTWSSTGCLGFSSPPNHPESHPCFPGCAPSSAGGGTPLVPSGMPLLLCATSWPPPGMSIIGTGAGGGAVTRVKRIPTPSIMPSRIPPNAADLAADRTPVRSCNSPPVNAAAAILFHGSSFLRRATNVQSKVEKRPPQTAKLPPILGASRRIDSMPPRMRAPDGAFFMPLSKCHRPPPTAPMPNAPPTSSKILSGHGSCGGGFGVVTGEGEVSACVRETPREGVCLRVW